MLSSKQGIKYVKLQYPVSKCISPISAHFAGIIACNITNKLFDTFRFPDILSATIKCNSCPDCSKIGRCLQEHSNDSVTIIRTSLTIKLVMHWKFDLGIYNDINNNIVCGEFRAPAILDDDIQATRLPIDSTIQHLSLFLIAPSPVSKLTIDDIINDSDKLRSIMFRLRNIVREIFVTDEEVAAWKKYKRKFPNMPIDPLPSFDNNNPIVRVTIPKFHIKDLTTGPLSKWILPYVDQHSRELLSSNNFDNYIHVSAMDIEFDGSGKVHSSPKPICESTILIQNYDKFIAIVTDNNDCIYSFTVVT